jgi:hypothetical protein
MTTSLVAAATLLLAAAIPLSPQADHTVTVDFGPSLGVPTGVGSGFLYGLSQDGSAPADNLLRPLDVKSGRGGGARIDGHGWIGDGMTAGPGYRVRITSALAQARRLHGYGASYDLLVSDLFGADTTQPASTVYPCTNGDCSNWITFIDQVVNDVKASGLTVNFDVWNEPDGTAFWPAGLNSPQYFQMWDTAVREIRRLAPDASIMGPSQSGWNPSTLGTFLDHAKSAGTVPTYLNWHFSPHPVDDARTARTLLSDRGITGVKLADNEYQFADEQHAGYEAWYLGQLAKSGITLADHAIWSDCCVTGSLDSTLVDGQPTGQWWVYQAYANVTGQLVSVDNGGASTDAVAAKDQSLRRATVLLGDFGNNTGTITLSLRNVPSWLSGSTGVQVAVQRIPDQNPLSQPVTVSTTVVTGNAAVPISWTSGTDAYFVTLSPADSPVTRILDGTVTSGSDYFQYGANWGQTNGVSDMYNGTANWSYVPGSVAQLHFTGSQVALHAVRDFDQGQMLLSMDGGPTVTVDDYAANRNASGIVWTSQRLANAAHTLTITVGSGQNPASAGRNIAIDRADLS